MPANGDAAMVETSETLGGIRKLLLACTCDSGDGSFSKSVTTKFSGILMRLETNPGATAPTDDYDLAISNASGTDLLEGLGANRDEANTEAVNLLTQGVVSPVAVGDALTVAITGNSVNSATVAVILYYQAA